MVEVFGADVEQRPSGLGQWAPVSKFKQAERWFTAHKDSLSARRARYIVIRVICA